jgi:hypothetical protein
VVPAIEEALDRLELVVARPADDDVERPSSGTIAARTCACTCGCDPVEGATEPEPKPKPSSPEVVHGSLVATLPELVPAFDVAG